jgi:hypothetical protein
MAHFIIFTLRTVSDPSPCYPLFLTSAQLDAAKALDSALDHPNVQLLGPIHSLAYALISTSPPEAAKDQFRSPNIVYLIFSNIRDDSVFETPETISKSLSKICWDIRATAVYQASICIDEYPDGMLG